MPRVSPFRGLRLDPRRAPLSRALCPHYDVISPAQATLLRRLPYNAVHLELPAGGPAARYRRALGAWKRWEREGVLLRDARPCFYVLEQRFLLGGRRLRRLGLVGALGLGAGSRHVVPHERTFAKPKQDRLRLLSALRANTSPIFALCPDRGGALRSLLRRASRGRPDGSGRSADGVRVRLWRVERPALQRRFSRALAARTLLVADGHHRLAVAREHRRRRRGAGGSGSTLCYLCAEQDPGLALLPTHRVLEAARGGARELGRLCRLRRRSSPAALLRALSGRLPPLAFGAAWRGGQAVAVPREPLGARLAVEWLDRALPGLKPGELSYTHESREALAAARRGGLALLLRPLTVRVLRRALGRGGPLPQKSTYFHPKVPAGAVFKEA